mgnify:FL=1
MCCLGDNDDDALLLMSLLYAGRARPWQILPGETCSIPTQCAALWNSAAVATTLWTPPATNPTRPPPDPTTTIVEQLSPIARIMARANIGPRFRRPLEILLSKLHLGIPIPQLREYLLSTVADPSPPSGPAIPVGPVNIGAAAAALDRNSYVAFVVAVLEQRHTEAVEMACHLSASSGIARVASLMFVAGLRCCFTRVAGRRDPLSVVRLVTSIVASVLTEITTVNKPLRNALCAGLRLYDNADSPTSLRELVDEFQSRLPGSGFSAATIAVLPSFVELGLWCHSCTTCPAPSPALLCRWRSRTWRGTSPN